MACGQLFGMRIPVTLAVKRKPHLLVLGVLLSSLAWDTVYISLGLIFGSVLTIKPVYMFLASLAGLTIIHAVTFVVQRLMNRFKIASLFASDQR